MEQLRPRFQSIVNYAALFLLCFTRWLLELIFYAVTSLKGVSYGNASAATLFTNNFPSDFDLMKKKQLRCTKCPKRSLFLTSCSHCVVLIFLFCMGANLGLSYLSWSAGAEQNGVG